MPQTAAIACLCGQISQRVLLANSSSIALCHCSSCRATTGQLCTSYLALHSPPSFIDDGSKDRKSLLTEYAQSDDVSRWFCAVCGAHVFAYSKHTDTYYVATGLLETTAVSLSSLFTHWGVRDTRDGGLSGFLQHDDDNNDNNNAPTNADVTACLLGPTANNTESHEKQQQRKQEENNDDIHHLQARCHCGGVSFAITRPDNIRSRSVSSPWPDLLVPYHLVSPHEKSNPDDVKWWLCDNNQKYLAGTCACTSCRLASGFPIQTWAFVSKMNIVTSKGGEEFEYRSAGSSLLLLQCYQSSPQVFREFCSGCGATVFWHCSERPGVVDVSVGLLRAQSGARAEDWLEWVKERVSFVEDAPDDPLIALLEKGLRGKGKC